VREFESLSMPIQFAATFTAHPIVHVNASLNAVAAVLLVIGFILIKQRRIEAHKRTMLSAFVVSIVFLACYLWYHYQVKHVKFTHSGTIRYVYYTVLASHVILAVAVPFLAIRQVYLGFRALGCCARKSDQADPAAELVAAAVYRDKHIRLSRWTFPIWLYVSVTGVIVYVMLYHLWPPVDQ
jgi:putative membrane protein